MKRNINLFLIVFILFFTGQETQAQKRGRGVGVAERVNPNFSYSPPQRDSVASTGLTIAILNPIFLDEDINKAGSPWSDFAKTMANDVEELLTAKGFKVRGPFGSIDEMVYGDKQNSDFIIQIVIDLDIKVDRKMKTGMNLLNLGSSNLSYRVDKGDVTINSNVNLTAISCFTTEKLWKKNLSITQKNFTYAGTVKWDGYPSVVTEFKQDVNLWNPVCKNLEEIYKSSFDILYRQFDKNEMANIAREARKSDGARRN